MLFSTFYFSGTGNTKWVVEQFNDIIVNNGHKSEIYTIDINEILSKEQLLNILNNSDFIGFANPIYGADIPPIMKKFINHVLHLHKSAKITAKPLYIINTFGYINAFGPFAAKRLFVNTGFIFTAYVNIRICNNVSTPKLKVNLINSDKLNRRKEETKKELLTLVKSLIRKKKYITGIGPYLILGIVIRNKVRMSIKNHYKSLSINADTCNKCLLCINNCPCKSIITIDNEIKFSNDCTACMRCYNFCPTSSILVDGKFADPIIYQRYRGPNTVIK